MDRSLELFVSQISGTKVYTFADTTRGASTANPLLYKIFPTGGYSTAQDDDVHAESSAEEIGDIPLSVTTPLEPLESNTSEPAPSEPTTLEPTTLKDKSPISATVSQTEEFNINNMLD